MKGVDVIIGGTLAPRSTPACAFAEALNAGIDCVVTVDDLVVLASPVTRRTAYLDVYNWQRFDADTMADRRS